MLCPHADECELWPHDGVDIETERWMWSVWKGFAREAFDGMRAERDALQARVDALMLEYCPDEMTEEQKAEWAKHQRPVSAEEQRRIDAALLSSHPQANATNE